MAIIHVLAAKSLIGAILTWRRDLLKKFPDDPRNELAQDLLSTLSKQPTNSIPADLVAKLDVLKTQEFSHYANNLARLIGFKYFPLDLADFLEGVLKYAEEERASPKQEGA
jgi:hypothetical protein